MSKNIWLLTEERPKPEVVVKIISKFMKDEAIAGFFDPIRFLPILNESGDFEFIYEVTGIKSEKIKKVFIKTVSGKSSFVDYLLFFQDELPNTDDEPLYVIEETKTDDSESRNSGINQRTSKFIYADFFYPNAKKVMLYNLKVEEMDHLTATNKFGMRCLESLGILVIGKIKRKEKLLKFNSIEDLIKADNDIRPPPAGNVPINVVKKSDTEITICGRLFKPGSGLSYDPNIGGLSMRSAALRNLGWKGKITIINHGLQQEHLGPRNKFIRIANRLNIGIDGLKIPKVDKKSDYWYYETKGEKLGTIFMHLAVENFTSGSAIYDNHAGGERSYFQKKNGDYVTVAKYIDKAKYKAGDKSQIIHIPDLILVDFTNSEVINAEGKTYDNKDKGIQELDNFDAIEDLYIKPSYKGFKVVRTVVIYGSENESIKQLQIGFLLNSNGKMVLGPEAPKLFNKAIENLIEYWS